MGKKKVILWFLILCYILGGCWCNPFEPKFKRNPNLRLLVSANLRDCFNPVFPPDGKKIYYLRTSEYKHFFNDGGQLRCVNSDGSDDRLILDGEFGSLAISPNGDKLAVTIDASCYYGGKIGIVDTLGENLETLNTSNDSILSIEFSSDGQHLYYYDKHYGYFKIGIDGTLETKLFDTQAIFWGFDISNDDKYLIFSDFIEDEPKFFLYSLY